MSNSVAARLTEHDETLDHENPHVARLSEDSFDFHEMLMRLHALSAVHRARARSPPGGAVR